jgi:GT2 family glycosyltransferase
MLVRPEVFHKVGLFDETYFAYSEDADFSMRAQKAGFSILHVPSAVATHLPSAPTIRNVGRWFRDYYVTRNKLLLIRRNTSGIRWVIFLVYFAFVYAVGPLVYFTGTGQFRRSAAILKGIRDFTRGRFGKRHEE